MEIIDLVLKVGLLLLLILTGINQHRQGNQIRTLLKNQRQMGNLLRARQSRVKQGYGSSKIPSNEGQAKTSRRDSNDLPATGRMTTIHTKRARAEEAEDTDGQ